MKRRSLSVLLAATAALLATMLTTAPNSSAANLRQYGDQIVNPYIPKNTPASCLSTVAHPATYIDSAVVTAACWHVSIALNKPPVPLRQVWLQNAVRTANGTVLHEIATAVSGHNNLCISEYVPYHQVRLYKCASYFKNPRAAWLRTRLWRYVEKEIDPAGDRADMLINAKTGRCLAPDDMTPVGTAAYTYPCASVRSREFWAAVAPWRTPLPIPGCGPGPEADPCKK